MQTLQATMLKLNRSVTAHVGGLSQQVEARLAKMKASQNTFNSRMDIMARETAELKKSLCAVQNDEPPAAPLSGGGFERRTNPCILVVRAAEMVSRDAIS
eukprot:426358-Pyramimonas_sp.AAC.1